MEVIKIQIIAYWALISEYLIIIGIQSCIVFILFRKWFQSTHRYFSDLPFIMAISFAFFIYDRIDSILGLTGIMPITAVSQLINLIGFIIITCINLLIMLIIWLPERKTLRSTFIITWFVLWFILIIVFMSTIGSPDTLHSVLFMMGLPIILLFTITWYFCYFQKRLSVINPLLVGIGFTGYFIGIILRVFLSLMGTPIGYVFTDLHWIAAMIDIPSFIIMLLGFSKEMSY